MNIKGLFLRRISDGQYISNPNSKRGWLSSARTTPQEDDREDQSGERQVDYADKSTVVVVLDGDVLGSARA